MTVPVNVPQDLLEQFCVRSHIRKLSLFGSVLTPRFRNDSDIDILVEFEPGNVPSYFELLRIQAELSNVVGRTVDLRTAGELSRYFRDEVVSTALTAYERT